jgi:FixJ family two-component response regulator
MLQPPASCDGRSCAGRSGAEPLPPGVRVSSREAKIVVVEDDAGMRRAMERLLTVAGFAARTFADADTLLNASAARSAQCLVLDVQLSPGNGFDLYQQLRDMGIHCPVVFITAYDGAEPRRRAHAAGGAFLPKPFAGRKLVETIAGVIEAHGEHTANGEDGPAA